MVAIAAWTMLLLSACGLPPVLTTEQHIFVPYAMIAAAPDGQGLLSGPFQGQRIPATLIAVPKETGAFKVTQAWLVCRVENGGSLPLDMDLFVSPGSQDPYQTKAIDERWHLPPASQSIKKEFPLDPSWLQGQSLRIGARFTSTNGVEDLDSATRRGVAITHQLRAVIQIL